MSAPAPSEEGPRADGAAEGVGPSANTGGQDPGTGPGTGPRQDPAAPIEASLLPLTAEVAANGHLVVGGVDVVDLAGDMGTPLFVYDEEHLRVRAREARAAFDDGVAYGSKAFFCRAMAELVASEGLCIDVATGGELNVALAAGVDASRLVLHGNNKGDDEIARAVDAGVGRIVIDSFDEIDRLERLLAAGPGASAAASRPQPVLVRVTPGVEAHTHEYVMTGQEDTKFGFSLASGAAARAVERVRSIPRLALAGLHCHIGSQIFLLDSYAKAIEVLAGFVTRLGLDELCIGGGLGVAYLNGESAPSITTWARRLRAAISEHAIPAGTRLTAEPGRAIAAGAALTLYRVGTIKELPGIRTWAAVDGGMSDNPRPVLYGSGYEAFLPRAVSARRERAVTVTGKHCESGDVLVRDAHVQADLAVGDVLATPVTGAYGYAMASNYNKVPRPAVVFVRNGAVRTVLRRETDEDLLRLDV